jgi:hypothetical protein
MPDIEYHQYQHVISNSPWDYKGVTAKVRSDVDEVMSMNEGNKVVLQV